MNQIGKCKILFFLLMFFSDFNVNICQQASMKRRKAAVLLIFDFQATKFS